MEVRMIKSETLREIADAVREREGTSDKIGVSDIALRILALPEGDGSGDSAPIYDGSFTVRETESGEEVGGSDGIQLQEKTVTENGEVTPDEGYDGLSKVIVDVPIPEPTLFDGNLEITENGSYEILPVEGYDGLSSVTVLVNVVDHLPFETTDEVEMSAILRNATDEDVGSVYKYTGPTGTYENGALYIIEKVGE
jgi:hypothetical protein